MSSYLDYLIFGLCPDTSFRVAYAIRYAGNLVDFGNIEACTNKNITEVIEKCNKIDLPKVLVVNMVPFNTKKDLAPNIIYTAETRSKWKTLCELNGWHIAEIYDDQWQSGIVGATKYIPKQTRRNMTKLMAEKETGNKELAEDLSVAINISKYYENELRTKLDDRQPKL